MAKAKEIPGLDCNDEALEAALKILRVRFDEVLDFRETALDFSDIEGVHDMRVALRRVRSALRDFTPLLGRRPLKRVRKDLKRLADVLGAVRDLDVFIAELERLQTEVEDETVKEGIGKLVRENRGLREIARLEMTEALETGRIGNLQERFRATIDEAAGRKKPGRSVSFTRAGADAITRNLEDLLDLGERIYEPFNERALHKLRIAAKRLRYAIKLFVVCWDQIAPLAKEIARMQSFLGGIHDCDVWIGILGRRLQETEPTNRIDHQTAVWLLSEFVRKRDRDYDSALWLWSEWETNDFAENMRAAIS